MSGKGKTRAAALSLGLLGGLVHFSPEAAAAGADDLWVIKVRKTAQSGSADIAKPATLSYIRPSDGPSTYAADIAFSKLLFPPSDSGVGTAHHSWETSGFVETHKNTLASKKQDTTLTGDNFAGQYGTAGSGAVWFPRFSAS